MNAKTAVAFAVATAAGAVMGGNVVHDAAIDMAVNQALANPSTNVYGGVWSYCYATTWDGGDRIPMSISVNGNYGGQIRGLSRYEGIAAPNYGVPYIMVMATGLSGVKCNSITGGAIVNSGEMIMHPGSSSDSVLRFEVPRNATYSGSFSFRTLAAASGTVKCLLLVNGEKQGELTLNHAVRDSDASKGELTLPQTALSRGDKIEIALNRSGEFSNDAVASRLRIVETVPDDVWHDACAEFPSFIARTNRTEKWGVYMTKSETSPDLYNMIPVPATDNIAKTTNGLFLAGEKYTGGSYGTYPYVLSNTNDVFLLPADAIVNYDLCPGELLMHPDSGLFPCICFAPIAPGKYTFRVQARDISMNRGTGQGVNVHLVHDGTVLASDFISLEAEPRSTYLEVTDLPLLVGEQVRVVVDAAGSLFGDATGVRLTVEKTASVDGVSLQEAFAANMGAATPVNPFVDLHGFSWTFGSRTGRIGGLDVSKIVKSYGSAYVKGWDCGWRPFVAQNLTGAILNAADIRVDAGPEGVGEIYPEEMILHPGNGEKYAVARSAPSVDGIYDVRTLFRHQNVSGDGIDAALIVRGEAYGAIVKQVCNVAGKWPQRPASLSSVYLKAGETIEVVVGSGPSRSYACDLTSMQMYLQPVVEEFRYVNVDLKASTSGNLPAKGAGRIGWSSDSTWNVIRVSDGMSTVQKGRLRAGKTNDRTGVCLTISADGQGTLAVRAASSADVPLQGDGILSTGSGCVRHFTLSGLVPREQYTLYLYSRDAQGGKGKFVVDSQAAESDKPWFNAEGGDFAEIHVTASEEGCVTGTFSGVAESSPAVFTGIQVVGRDFADPEPTGLLLMVE